MGAGGSSHHITPTGTYEIPYGACNVDHDEGKTRWQRVAEVLDTGEEPVTFWYSSYAEDRPRWEAGRAFALLDVALGIGTDREYGSAIGPNRWTVWVNLGPFSWWLVREWPATKAQRGS